MSALTKMISLRLWVAVLLSGALPSFADEPAAPPGVDDGKLSGKIQERLDAAGYTYLLVSTGAGPQWAAVPRVEVSVGEAVTIAVQAQMGDFESRSLKRKFDRIFFGTVEGKRCPPGHPEVSVPAGPRHSPPSTTPAPRSATGFEGEILELLQVPGYTYLRIRVGKEETWAAVPTATLAVGQRARIEKPAPMDGFFSKTLNRAFPRIVFGSLGQVSPAPEP